MTSTAADDQRTKRSAPDLKQVREHVSAIRQDIALLAATTTSWLADQARSQARRFSDLGKDGVDKAGVYRDAVASKVKDHPLAAVGLAVIAGLALSSLRRR